MDRKIIKTTLLIVTLAFVMSAGCAGTIGPAYSGLDPVAPVDGPVAMTQGKRPLVAVGPIDLPGYIDHAATIMETTINPANISAVDQKDSILETEIPGVLTENVRRLLAPRGVDVVPYTRARNADYRIALRLTTFDITDANTLEARAQWVLYDAGRTSPVMVRDSSFSTPVEDRGDAGRRVAMSRSLADLARAIVKDLGGVLEAK